LFIRPQTKQLILKVAARWRSWAKQRANERMINQLLEEDRRERERALKNKTYQCPVCFVEYHIEDIYLLDECFHRFCFPVCHEKTSA
jgi:hypothetical protein